MDNNSLKRDYDQNQDDRITALEKGQLEILELLKPISETYRSVNLMGKWFMALAVFVSILAGVFLSISKIFHK